MTLHARFAAEVLATVDALRAVRDQLRFLVAAEDDAVLPIELEVHTAIVLGSGLADALERIGRHMALESHQST